MEIVMKISSYERFLISKDNIIVEVNVNFLGLIGYSESEILGMTLLEASKILRIDSQVNLKDMKGDTRIFLFTKLLVAIEGTISCKTIDNGVQKIFLFKVDYFNLANEKFDLADQLGTSRGDGVAIFSYPSLALINSNKNYLNLLEPPYNKRSNSIGKSIMEISNDYSNSQFNNIKDHIINTGTPYHIEEMEIYSKVLGEEYWNITLVPILDKGIIKYIILSVSNVTENVLNRKAIEQKNEDLEAVIGNINDEIITFDKDFNIILSNKGVEGYFEINNPSLKNLNDISKNSIAYNNDDQLIPYGDFPFQRVARGESISNFFMIKENSSGLAYREVSGSPVYDKEGEFGGGVMVYRDIKHRIQEEESRLIKTQKELLTKVVDALDLEFVRCTFPELEIVSINDNGLKKLKKINNRIESMVYPIGKSYFAIYPIDEEKKRKELELYLIEQGHYSYIDYENHVVAGEKRFFKTINQPIFGLNNKIVEIIFITTDITDEIKVRNKMEETLDSQNQMFANISHELKTPLSVIYSASQLIELYINKEIDNIVKENISKNIDIIKQNCFRFTKLINNIVDLSSMESGFYSLNFRNINIIEIVEDIVDSVSGYAEGKGLNIIFDTEMEVKVMAVDVDKMERIMLNLISNAVKFSPKDGTIYIHIKDKGDYVDIIVSDCGAGIDQKNLNTIFDKYHKVDNTLYRNAEGSGIGLTLVKIMVELLGGKISVESEIGKGALFTVSLPVNVLDESKGINALNSLDNTIDNINIEFSDVYFN